VAYLVYLTSRRGLPLQLGDCIRQSRVHPPSLRDPSARLYEVYIGGQCTHVGSCQDFLAARAYLDDFLAACFRGRAGGFVINSIARVLRASRPVQPLVGKPEHFRADSHTCLTEAGVGVCTRIMIGKWGCRFGAVDIFIDAHCQSIINFLRLEN